MSIKVIDKQIKGSAGVAKRINKGAEKMVFDILQATQYSTPISSTVRELTTNACDSQREKEIAIEILKGEAKIEDYYIERHGDQYEDSNFDPSYYSLKQFNTEENSVKLIYEKHIGVGYCDKFRVIDYGVGIGDRRIEGVLELGYSTKRNTAENFGAFGLGAKVALSTGVDFYTIETVHNGKRFKCNCYNYKTDFIIPAFDMSTGKPNPHIVLSDGTKVYYESTDLKNFTEVSLGVKRHNRRKFEDSIEEQLLYLENVNYYTHDYEDPSEGKEYYEKECLYKPKIVHNSENLIISDTYMFNKPHIVLVKDGQDSVGINYGFIDFRELEMQDMWGPIAFKCPARQVMNDPDTGEEIVLQEGVDVTPSREKVIWNEATKRYVESVIMKAAEEATDIVQEELKQEDFISWITACKDILSNTNSSSVVGKLSNIIDKDMLNPKFSKDSKIQFKGPSTLFNGLNISSVNKNRDYKTGVDEIERDKLSSWDKWGESKIYIKSEDYQFNKFKDLYISHTGEFNTFIVINDKVDESFPEKILKMQEGQEKTKAKSLWRAKVAKSKDILEFLKSSKHIKSYDDLEIDEEWLEEYKKDSKAAEEVAKFDHLTPAERRAIEERMVAYTLRVNTRHFGYSERPRFIWDKIEPKVKDLMKTQKITYYGTKADEEKIKFAAGVLRKFAPSVSEVFPDSRGWDDDSKEGMFYYDICPVRFYNYNSNKPSESFQNMKTDWKIPQLIRVAEKCLKHISTNPNCKHIDEFFLQLTDNNGYTMDEHLIKWYTADKVKDVLNKKYLSILKDINPDLFDRFKTVYDYVDELKNQPTNYLQNSDIYKDIDKLAEFHQYCIDVEDAPDKDSLIANKSREIFVLDIKEALGFDREIMDLFNELNEYDDEIKVLLSRIEEINNPPSKNQKPLKDDFKKELCAYLESKDRLTWENQ